MHGRTLFLITLLILSVGLMLLVLRRETSQERPSLKKPSPTVTPQPAVRNFTTLVASPSASSLSVGEEASFVVVIDTEKNNVASVQLEMLFNPEHLRVLRIEPLDFFAQPTVLINEVNNKVGSISYALGATTPRVGRGNLVRVTVVSKKTTASSSTQVVFLPKSSVGEIGNQASVLKDALGPIFVIR